jgi:hypothetical protein
VEGPAGFIEGNISPLRRRGRPVRGPSPRDIISHTQTPAAPGADGTAISRSFARLQPTSRRKPCGCWARGVKRRFAARPGARSWPWSPAGEKLPPLIHRLPTGETVGTGGERGREGDSPSLPDSPTATTGTPRTGSGGL